MNDDTNKKGKLTWTTSYSNISVRQAEKILGFRIRTLRGIPVDRMLANINANGTGIVADSDTVLKVKEKVFDNILDYLTIEGYPTEADPDFKESNINHLVYATISPLLSDFIHRTGRSSIQLRSEKEIVSTDGETGGEEEFVVMDFISVEAERFIFIVEAKRSSVGQAMKQCLLAMKDAWDNNGGGTVYGFVTTGDDWRMLSYNGSGFVITERFTVLFDGMMESKEKWMKENTILVECVYAALSNGGIVNA